MSDYNFSLRKEQKGKSCIIYKYNEFANGKWWFQCKCFSSLVFICSGEYITIINLLAQIQITSTIAFLYSGSVLIYMIKIYIYIICYYNFYPLPFLLIMGAFE